VDSVDEGYALISNNCKKVVVGGFSFGGGLALDMAARIKDVAGVFAVCPPMKLQDHATKLAPAVGIWNWMMNIAHYDGGKMKYVDITPEHPHINYNRVPVSGINELKKFMSLLEEKLSAIESPALVIQADGDPVVVPYASKDLFEKIGSGIKEYRLIEAGRHGILLGQGAVQVHAIIGDFIDSLNQGKNSQVKAG
jgi:esterase/lipase